MNPTPPLKKEKWNVYKILLQNEDLFDAVQNNALQGYILFHLSAPEEKWISPKLLQTLDLRDKPDEILKWNKIIAPEDLNIFSELQDLQNYAKGEFKGVLRLRHFKGYILTMDFFSYLTKDEKGEDLVLIAFRRKNFSSEEISELQLIKERGENDRINRQVFEGSFKNAAWIFR